jgi:hypothetical protein
VNATLKATLGDVADEAQRVDDLSIRLRADLRPSSWRGVVDAVPDRLCLPEVDEKALTGLKFSEALPWPLAVAARAGALTVVQRRARVVQGVAGTVVGFEEDGDVVAGMPGAVDVATGFFVSDGLLIVVEGLPGIPGLGVDDANLVVNDRVGLDGVGGGPAGGGRWSGKQVQHGELGALGFGEGVGEPVGQRGGQ